MIMGDKGKGKDKMKAKKAPKAGKGGLRPHEQRRLDVAESRPK
jgi:hypothetical protein